MKKNKILCLCVILITVMMSPIVAHADKAYIYRTIDHSQVFKGKRTITLKNYYRYVQLKGNTQAIRKFNKTTKNAAVKTMKQESGAIEYAQNDCNSSYSGDETYEDYCNEKVTYYTGNIISVYYIAEWYAGGVGNTFESGATYDIKNGKYLNLLDVTKEKSEAKIKETLKKKIEAENRGYDSSEVDSKDISEFEFYINKKGNVIVCFGPYELGYGGWSKTYKLEGDSPK